MMRHTMGQDWGGRRKSNPDECPIVSSVEVIAFAKERGFELRKNVVWFVKEKDGEWRSIGDTNYWALENLKSRNKR